MVNGEERERRKRMMVRIQLSVRTIEVDEGGLGAGHELAGGSNGLGLCDVRHHQSDQRSSSCVDLVKAGVDRVHGECSS